MNSAATFFRLCRQRQPPFALRKANPASRWRACKLLSTSNGGLAPPESISLNTVLQPEDGLPPSHPRYDSPAITEINTSSDSGAVMTDSSSRSKTAASTTNPHAPGPSNLSKADDDSLQHSVRIIGTVSRTGTMQQTVAVRTEKQVFDRFLKKHYNRATTALVYDQNNILVEGDVIAYSPFSPGQRTERALRGKKNVKFLLQHVITPFGLPLDQRIPKVTVPGKPRSASKKNTPPRQQK